MSGGIGNATGWCIVEFITGDYTTRKEQHSPPQRTARLPQHHRPAPVQKHPVLEVQLHGAGERDALDVAAGGGEVFR